MIKVKTREKSCFKRKLCNEVKITLARPHLREAISPTIIHQLDKNVSVCFQSQIGREEFIRTFSLLSDDLVPLCACL